MFDIVYRYLDVEYNINFPNLEGLYDSRNSIQKDKIITSSSGEEQLSELILEIELGFNISRDDAFWVMHDWLITKINKHINSGGNDVAESNLKYLLGWFTQMV